VKVFVSAGEVSGDLILGGILAGLRQRFPDLEAAGLGGAEAAKAGLQPLFPLERTAVSGIGDVLGAAGFVLAMRRRALLALAGFKPDLVLLVDYPGLNLALARRARDLGIPVYYVAPPQAWAYRNPARKLRKAARSLAGATVHVLYPFEAADFPFAGKVVSGHFLAMPAKASADAGMPAPDVLCLCPGSRLPVLRRNLPAWLAALDAAGCLPGGKDDRGLAEAAILVPAHLQEAARSLSRPWQGRCRNLRVTSEKAEAFSRARVALAFPGTVTLELALHGVAAGVVAALDPLTLALGRRVLRDTSLGLPNLLLRKNVFPEWAGRAARLDGAAMEFLWNGLWRAPGDWAPVQDRLRVILGPTRGCDVAVGECARILRKS
jgi:lipid-A-disaccharide synthase